MKDLERAKALQATGRHVHGLTRLVPEPLPCDLCRAEGRETSALVAGRTRAGKPDVRMCAAHFAREGSGLGPEAGQVLLPLGPPAPIEVPAGTEPAGYAKAIIDFALTVTTPHRLRFLYEYLTDRRLGASDLRTGNYVPLLNEAEYYTAPARRSPRHRVLDNLLGTRAFCPTVRRTECLRAFENKHLAEEAAKIVAEFDQDAIRRAVSYLYTKEIRSSFSIEGESPSSSKTERFVGLLKAARVR